VGKFDLDDLLKDLGRAKADAEETASEVDGIDPSGLFDGDDAGAAALDPDDDAGAESDRAPDAGADTAPDGGTDDSSTAIYKPQYENLPEGTDALGICLIERGALTTEQLASARRLMKQSPGKRHAQILVEIGVPEADVQQAVADLNRLPFERIDPANVAGWDARSLNRLGMDYCKTHLVLPLRREGSRMMVGTVNPDDVFLLDDVKRRLGVGSIKHVLVTSEDINAVIESLGEERTEEIDVTDILADVDEDDVTLVKHQEEEADLGEAESSPVVRYVNHIIQTAIKEGASDIHIEAEEKQLRVRFRIDGVLFEMMNPPRSMHAALTSRIKIMANLDIAERRLPQDGRIRANVHGRKIDLRVSTVPTPKGEKTVMRLLDNKSISVELDELGFGEDTLTIWRNQISQPHGIILVTGPTGSGKTTTLYSSIQQLDLRRLNVSTVEDPVEYNLVGITQMQMHEKIGMTFSVALRALMRQDPDVIMLGEIRDMETATISIQAAMTGHLVLSTLHTNDAPSSITRLINIGIEPFLVSGAVRSVLAQRLVRRICAHCLEEVPVSEEIGEFLSMHGVSATSIMQGAGCVRCRETGYSGRAGLYELLVLDDHLGDAVARNPAVTEFRRICAERGMVTLREDGFKKVSVGATTVEEVLRVTESTI
jgi:type IV pilus assembly protein PilB